jgi:hypothetical protein
MDAEEVQLQINGWPSEWNELVHRILDERNGGSSRRKMLRKIAKVKNEEEGEQKVCYVNKFRDDQFPENSVLITHLDYYCNNPTMYMDLLRSYLASPEFWPKLRCIRVLKQKYRSLQKIIVYTPIVSGFRITEYEEDGQKKKKQEWDNKLALTRRLERFYTRSTLFVLDHGWFGMMDQTTAVDTTQGQILISRRDQLENEDGRKYRFCKNDDGAVSLVKLEPGFVYPGDIGPIIEYDPNEDYRRWDIPTAVFIPKSLGGPGFVEKCKNIRKMVSGGDSCFKVVVLDFFIGKDGKDIKLFGEPPPPLDPMVKFNDTRVELFVKEQSLVGVQPDPPLALKDSEGGLVFDAPTKKRVLAWTPGARSLIGGGENKKNICRR